LFQAELAAFEKELLASTALQEEVEKHRVLHETLSDTDTLAFREKLMRISEEIKAEEQATSSGSSQYWKIAASIAIVLGVATLLWFFFFENNPYEDLYASYYTPFPIEDTTRGETDTEYKEVLSNYAKGEYKIAITALEKAVTEEESNQFSLYLGNSYINTNQEKKAIPIFEEIAKSSKYYENAQWYLALTYLKLKDKKQVISILKELVEYNGVYKDKSINLLEGLQ